MKRYNIDNLKVQELIIAHQSLSNYEWPWVLGKAPKGWETAPNYASGLFHRKSRFQMMIPVKKEIYERLGYLVIREAENLAGRMNS